MAAGHKDNAATATGHTIIYRLLSKFPNFVDLCCSVRDRNLPTETLVAVCFQGLGTD